MGVRSLRSALLLAGLAALTPDPAAAGPVNAREHRQRERIHTGIEDGSLTRPEAHRLRHEQVRTERIERRFRRNDGQLGPRERARLDRRLDHSSAHIHRARHNARER
jgi:hypothetical protein